MEPVLPAAGGIPAAAPDHSHPGCQSRVAGMADDGADPGTGAADAASLFPAGDDLYQRLEIRPGTLPTGAGTGPGTGDPTGRAPGGNLSPVCEPGKILQRLCPGGQQHHCQRAHVPVFYGRGTVRDPGPRNGSPAERAHLEAAAALWHVHSQPGLLPDLQPVPGPSDGAPVHPHPGVHPGVLLYCDELHPPVGELAPGVASHPVQPVLLPAG